MHEFALLDSWVTLGLTSFLLFSCFSFCFYFLLSSLLCPAVHPAPTIFKHIIAYIFGYGYCHYLRYIHILFILYYSGYALQLLWVPVGSIFPFFSSCIYHACPVPYPGPPCRGLLPLSSRGRCIPAAPCLGPPSLGSST